MRWEIEPLNLTWLETEFTQVGAFSLRPSNTTANAGRSLLLPTPYAIKMALLDQLISQLGVEVASSHFAIIRDLEIYIEPPQMITVSELTRQIQRIDDIPNRWKGNLVKQQYCLYSNPWHLCLGTWSNEFLHLLSQLIVSLEYLGQRGGFIQSLGTVDIIDKPSPNYISLSREVDLRKVGMGVVQRMDDMQSNLSFEDVSRFNSGENLLDTRRQYNILTPYRLIQNNNNYLVYEYRN
jgi:hypothetical protein